MKKNRKRRPTFCYVDELLMPQKAYFDQQVLKTCIIEGIDTFGLYVLVHSLVFLIAILSLDKRPDKNDIYYLFLPNIDREATLPYA